MENNSQNQPIAELVTKASYLSGLASLGVVTTTSRYIAYLLFVTLPFIGGYVGYMYGTGHTEVVSTCEMVGDFNKSLIPTQSPDEQKIVPTTKTSSFNSPTLGVSFTYDATPEFVGASELVKVAEVGNRIELRGDDVLNSITVYQIDEKIDPAVAVSRAISVDGKEQSCPLQEVFDSELNDVPGYRFWRLQYDLVEQKETLDLYKVSCPILYATTDDYRYLAYNPEAPDRFLLVDLGKMVVTLEKDRSESVEMANDLNTWNQSLRIMSLD